MAQIGSFGDLTFKVSDKFVRTFDGMSWDFSAKYATHDRHIKADLIEYMGLKQYHFQWCFLYF